MRPTAMTNKTSSIHIRSACSFHATATTRYTPCYRKSRVT